MKTIAIFGEHNSGTNAFGSMLKFHLEQKGCKCAKTYLKKLADDIKTITIDNDFIIIPCCRKKNRIRYIKKMIPLEFVSIKINRGLKTQDNTEDFDIYIENNKTLDELREKAKNVCEKLLLQN